MSNVVLENKIVNTCAGADGSDNHSDWVREGRLELTNLIFLSSLNWIFADYTGSKNQVKTIETIKFVKVDFSN